jgi:predicted DNA binding protein
MSVLAEFTVGTDSLALGEVFEEFPGAEIELERIVPTTDALIPYVWIRGIGSSDAEQIEALFVRLPANERIKLVDHVGDSFLFRLEWEPGSDGILGAIAETEVTMVSGLGSRENWSFELRCDHQEELAEFQEYCDAHGIQVELTVLHELSATERDSFYGLTTAQQQALVRAHQRGFWRSPRETSLEELAEEFGITGQALGSRLRRGIDQLVGSALDPTSD